MSLPEGIDDATVIQVASSSEQNHYSSFEGDVHMIKRDLTRIFEGAGCTVHQVQTGIEIEKGDGPLDEKTRQALSRVEQSREGIIVKIIK